MDVRDRAEQAGHTQDSENERGRRPMIDRTTGEVHGSGVGAGGGAEGEDYDEDPTAGSGRDDIGDRRGDAGEEGRSS